MTDTSAIGFVKINEKGNICNFLAKNLFSFLFFLKYYHNRRTIENKKIYVVF